MLYKAKTTKHKGGYIENFISASTHGYNDAL
jgi:hypothetical protein